MYGIHFCSTFYPVGINHKEVTVHAPGEHFTVGDLCFMAFTRAKFGFPFQIYVPGSKKPLVNICVKGAHGHIQFRMVCDNLIRRLSLVYQMGNEPVFVQKFLSGHVDSVSAAGKKFTVFPVSKTGIIDILMCDGAFVECLVAAVTDIWGFIQAYAPFPDKIPAGLVASRAGSTFDAAEDDLAAGIGFVAVVSMDTEVFGIIKSAFVVPVAEAVFFYLFRDGGRILAQEAADVLERHPLRKCFLNVKPVFEGEVFLVSRYKITHHVSFHCCQKAW